MNEQCAHPDDILIIGTLSERGHYPAFAPDQVYAASMPHRLLGRRFRTAWITDRATLQDGYEQTHDRLLVECRRSGATMRPYEVWQPEPVTLADLIRSLPADNSTSSRDFGRGYAKAVRDVLDLMEATLG